LKAPLSSCQDLERQIINQKGKKVICTKTWRSLEMKYTAIDLFSGGGGLSEGMRQAGFDVVGAIEINPSAVSTYHANHPETTIFPTDICDIQIEQIIDLLHGRPLDLLAGCPPCQGFSSVRCLNGQTVRDKRNKLILEYLRFVEGLHPNTIMMENVSGLTKYYLFKKVVKSLKFLGYNISFKVINVKDYGVPQRRKRMVLIGSRLGEIEIVSPNGEKQTVREAFAVLRDVNLGNDPLSRPALRHSKRIQKLISLIPKDGGSRSDLPSKYILDCHKKDNVGFADIYGRLRWDDYSNTITGGCLNPSKGRFLHPEENRAITPREAALLQTFPIDYVFPLNIGKSEIAKIIGEALPPKFSRIQCAGIKSHLDTYFGRQILA